MRFHKKHGYLLLSLIIVGATLTSALRISPVSAGSNDNPVQITTTGCPNSQNCSFGNYPTESSFALPYTQQKIFQNPRPASRQDFYVFYSQNVSLPGSGCSSAGVVSNLCYECVYADSHDGMSWRVNQTIGLSPAGVGNSYINCSAAYFDDTANKQLIVYVAAARNAGSANTNHNIELVVGILADSADSITWSAPQIVSRSSSTQNFQFPVVQVDPNGYLQIAYSWVDTSVNRQTVDLCSSRVSAPTSNSSWTCVGGGSNELFNAQTVTAQTSGSFMPQLQPVPGHSVLVLQGPCGNIATSACANAASPVENATLVDWDGTVHTFAHAATFTYPASSPSDRRSSIVDPATGNLYLAYHNGTDDRFWTRFMMRPYNSWSSPTRITADFGEGRILLLTGTGTHTTLAFIEATDAPKLVSGGGGTGTCGTCPSINMYVNTTNMGTAWSSATTLYSNTTWAATWSNTPWVVNTSTSNKLPVVWEQHVCGHATNVQCTSQPEELWFDPHILFAANIPPPIKASFSFSPSSPDAGQPVSFSASISGGVAPYIIAWSVNDGGTGSGSSFSHTFAKAGTFNVTLGVTDSRGQAAETVKTVTVNPSVTASFSYTPSTPLPLLPVTFTSNASGGVGPYSYGWNFGDGSTASGQSTSHSYLLPGSYTVTLTVSDANGQGFVTSQTITVLTSLV